MKILNYLSAAIVLFMSVSSCKKEDIAGEWHDRTFAKYYGHVLNSKAADIIKTPDNGYLILGTSNSYTSLNNDTERKFSDAMYLVKTDSLGNEMWSRVYGEEDASVRAQQIIFDSLANEYYLLGTATELRTTGLSLTPRHHRIVYYHIDAEGEYIGTKFIPNRFTSITSFRRINTPREPNGIHDFEFSSAVLHNDLLYLFGTTTAVSQKSLQVLQDDLTDYCLFRTPKYTQDTTNSTVVINGGSYKDRAVKMIAFNHTYQTGSERQLSCLYNLVDNNRSAIYYRIVNFNMPVGANAPTPINTNDASFSHNADLGILATDFCVEPMSTGNKFTVIGVENYSADLDFSSLGRATITQFGLPYGQGIFERGAIGVVKTYGSWESGTAPARTNHITPLGDDNGYLVTATSTRLQNINSDVQLINFDRDLSVRWDALYGTGASMDLGVKSFLIDSTIENSQLRPITGIGILGSFDFGSNNTMIGFLKTNTKGELRAN